MPGREPIAQLHIALSGVRGRWLLFGRLLSESGLPLLVPGPCAMALPGLLRRPVGFVCRVGVVAELLHGQAREPASRCLPRGATATPYASETTSSRQPDGRPRPPRRRSPAESRTDSASPGRRRARPGRRVKYRRKSSDRPLKRGIQPRTVPSARPRYAATCRCSIPRAAISSPAPITSAASDRRG